MMQFVNYLLIIFVTFIIGFACVLLSNQVKKSWIPISFTIGTAVLILIAFWTSYFSKKGLRPWAELVLVILLLLVVAVFLWKRKRIVDYLKTFTKGDFISLCLCIGAGSLPMALYIIYGAQFPYCDGFTYVCIADYLMDSGYNVSINTTEVLTHPWLSQMMLYQTSHFRIGAQMLLSLFSCLFRVENSIELFLPLTSFGVMWIGMSVWQLVEENYDVSVREKIAAVSIVCFNVPIVLWNAMYGFLPQTFGSALFVANIAFFLYCDKWRENGKWDIIIASLITGCFALTYSELLPFLVLVIFVIVLAKIIIDKVNIKRIIGNVFLCGLLAILAIIVYFPGMIMAILSELGAVVGWNQEKGLLTYLSYFFSIVPAEYSYRNSVFDGKTFMFESITLIIFVAAILGYCKSEKKIKCEYAYVSLPFLSLFIWFAFFAENPFNGRSASTWSIFKMMQYYFVIAAPFLAMFLYTCFKAIKKHRFLFFFFIALFTLYNGKNSIFYAHTLAQQMAEYTGNNETPLEEYYELYQKYGDYDGVICLHDVPVKHRQMITYYLKDTPLISDWKTDGYFNNMPRVDTNIFEQDNDVTLTYVGNAELEKDRIIFPLNQKRIANMVEMQACITFCDGVYGEETDEIDAWRWCEDKATLDVCSYNASQRGTIEFEVWPVAYAGSKLIVCDACGNAISETPLSTTEFTDISIPVSFDDKNVIQVNILFEGDKMLLPDTETRNLAFRTREWRVNLE